MTAPDRWAASIRPRSRTDEKTGDELPHRPAATFWTDLRTVLQEPLHEHLEAVSALFTKQIIRSHLLQHPHPLEFVDDPSEGNSRGRLDRLADQHQGKRPTLLDGAHQRRVLLKGGAVHVEVVDANVVTVVELKIAIDVPDCLFQRQGRRSAAAATGIIPARTNNQELTCLYCFHHVPPGEPPRLGRTPARSPSGCVRLLSGFSLCRPRTR